MLYAKMLIETEQTIGYLLLSSLSLVAFQLGKGAAPHLRLWVWWVAAEYSFGLKDYRDMVIF